MFDLDLKNRKLAALLAWLVPGAGHLYQGRTAKGLLLLICISSTFLFGFYVGGGKVAYASPLSVAEMAERDPGQGRLRQRLAVMIDRWPFFCQSGIGSVAIPGLIERARFRGGKPELFGGAFRPPSSEPTETFDRANNKVQHPNELAEWNYTLGFDFELGTMYTVVAGLLNILAVYDAHSGPLIMRPPSGDETDEEESEANNSAEA